MNARSWIHHDVERQVSICTGNEYVHDSPKWANSPRKRGRIEQDFGMIIIVFIEALLTKVLYDYQQIIRPLLIESLTMDVELCAAVGRSQTPFVF